MKVVANCKRARKGVIESSVYIIHPSKIWYLPRIDNVVQIIRQLFITVVFRKIMLRDIDAKNLKSFWKRASWSSGDQKLS